MAPLPQIASLWIGGRLSWLEQLCLKSFADAGHEVTLFSYAPIDNLPAGVRAGDAGDIFPAEPMYRHRRTDSPAIHADLWRLHLLRQTDMIWVDADMYCWRPFDFRRQSVFGWEKEGLVCNAVLGLPRSSRALAGLLEFFQDEYAIAPWLKPWQQAELEAARAAGDPLHMTEQSWGFTGPAAVTWFLRKTGEIRYAEPQSAFYPVSFRNRNQMILSRFSPEEEFDEHTRGVHFWARRMKPRLEEKENNTPRRGSFMEGLIEKHGIDPAAAPIPRKIITHKAPIDDPAFQAKIAIEALRGDASAEALARKHLVAPSFVKDCRRRLEEAAPRLFAEAAGRTNQAEAAE